jgi:hypothetical protein
MARTLIVGDVHGCAAELSDLLSRAAFGAGDRLVFVGDLVARGPDSRGVLRIARETGALAVLGNHELRLLDARAGKKALPASHEALAAELDDEDWSQIEAMPTYLRLTEHGLAVVHAGVVPGIALERQDPWVLTHVRSIDPDGTPSSKLRPPLWATRYTGPPHVVFGHNALTGLQLQPWATGLDTACVYGKELSALVLDAGDQVPPPDERRDVIVSVPARGAYYRPGD